MKKTLVPVLVAALVILCCSVKSFGQNPVVSGNELKTSEIQYHNEGLSYMPDPTRPQQVKNTMQKATAFIRSISTKGGYVGMYSVDLKKRYGEGFYELALPNDIFTQYPGTPAMGECFLRAYKITGDEDYLGAAYDAGRALAWGQKAEGGWNHLVDVSHLHSHSKIPDRVHGDCTFDDNISQGSLMFLMDLDQSIDAEWLTESIDLGLNFMLESQAENGAWPQWYPSIGSYHDYWTFNDDAINSCIQVMMRAYQQYQKPEYLESVKKAGDFIIAAQFDAPQAGWAQQYKHDMTPGWARRFEPPGVCSKVTASTIKSLTEIYFFTKDEKYLKPIPEAIKWLKDSKMENGEWARIYEMKTNKPIYGQHDRIVHYLASEGRSDYSFHGTFGIDRTIDYCNKVLKEKSNYQEKAMTPTARDAKIDNMMKSIQKSIALLDDRGRWVDHVQQMINLEDFVNNMNLFCEYLELMAQK